MVTPFVCLTFLSKGKRSIIFFELAIVKLEVRKKKAASEFYF
jgi:hypothetical protein